MKKLLLPLCAIALNMTTEFLQANAKDPSLQDRFIIKYVENQEKLSQEKINTLSKIAGSQIQDLYTIATGAHVIRLSKGLDKSQTEQFIRNVRRDNGVVYIEADEIMHAW